MGLATTITVMHVFKAAQPALLYLSPACILAVLLVAVVRGELAEVFAYKSEKALAAAVVNGAATDDEKVAAASPAKKSTRKNK